MFPNTRRRIANIKHNSKKISMMLMSPQLQLRMFQNRFRECQSADEERRVLLTECTFIRDAFASNRFSNENQKLGCLLKLVYIANLGIVESPKGEIAIMEFLCAKRFEAVRIACLSAILLLDETSDLLLMMTNAVQNLLNHRCIAYKNMALNLLATIGSKEMCNELATKICNLIEQESKDPLIFKKALVCSFVIARKVPDLADMFFDLSKDHNFYVYLIVELSKQNADYRKHFKKFIPSLVQNLKELRDRVDVEMTVNYVNDPVSQIKLIQLLVLLDGESPRANQEIVKILLSCSSAPATTTKLTGYAPMFEACRAILALNCQESAHEWTVEKLDKYARNTNPSLEQRYMAIKILSESFARKPQLMKWSKIWDSVESDTDPDIRSLTIRKVTASSQLNRHPIEKQTIPEKTAQRRSSHEEDLAELFGISFSAKSLPSSKPSPYVQTDNLIDLDDSASGVPFLSPSSSA